MGIIFDLDQTLLDSRVAEAARQSRRWSEVYELIQRFQPYRGVADLLADLKAAGVPLCIVTSSPKTYCSRVVSHFGFPFQETALVCYHDTQNKKPHPEPIQLALQRIGCTPTEAISIGDAVKDIQASRAAGVFAVGVTWGSDESDELEMAGADAVCNSIDDLRNLLEERGFL